MFKLIPARGPLHTFKDGDVIEVRRGHNTVGQIMLAASPRGTSVTFYDAEGERRFTSERTAAITTENIRDIWWHTTYGTALYLKVEEVKPTTVPVTEFTLNKGMRFTAKLYGNIKAEIVVNDKVTTDVGPQVWNVMIKRLKITGGNTHEHITKLSDIKGLEVDSVKIVCPNGVEAIPEDIPDFDEEGEFIVWCPTSDRPPRVILGSRAQAKAVAISMSERHNGTFHWCKLLGKAEQVTKRTTKITD